MASTTYGDISPRVAGHMERELLKRGMPWMLLEKFGTPKSLYETDYWDDDKPEVEDCLYTCTGRCHARWPCPLKDVHSEDEVELECCANYYGEPLTGMVGEQFKRNEKTIKFRRYTYGCQTPDPVVAVTTEA